MACKTIKLNTGAAMPTIGLGTWKSKPGEVKAAVETAIDAGYRHIDCSIVYRNEAEIGEAIQSKIQEGVIRREDLFITSKLFVTFHRRVRDCIERSLRSLKLECVDLYLIHWPMGFHFNPGDVLEMTKDGKPYMDEEIHYVDVWKEMEKLQKEGLTKAIGVSNFNKHQVAEILQSCAIPPAVNQYESHAYLQQDDLLKFCQSNAIVVTAYSPLGSADRPWAKPDDPKPLEDAIIKEIAEKHNKTAAQVLLRYQIQRGMVVIPKSVTQSRIQSNFLVFDFELNEDEVSLIRKPDRNWRALKNEWLYGHKHHPFNENNCE
uniref:aldo-keto reductase family 1 member B1-like isoform X1 n=1 Tax=Styela clava TaxID=7725 RepID=UPI00193A41EC|nr:aldo-keto reductase family 1 member B1-like isoform X1 [Styela clava]XP_039255636.1 aldo-keto reductase family 1 member B1-like isoform X2 [Styela clava]